MGQHYRQFNEQDRIFLIESRMVALADRGAFKAGKCRSLFNFSRTYLSLYLCKLFDGD